MRSLIAIALIGWCATAAHALTAADFQGKNIVVFITDQERYTMHFPKGWEEANMPGLQRLKAHGMTFHRHYANSVTCSSARACMMTGLMPPQHRVRYKLRYSMPANLFPQVELPADIANWATVAKAAGYTTVYKGKIDLFKGPNSTVAGPQELKKYGFSRWNPPDSGLGLGPEECGGGTNPEGNYDERYMHSRAANQSEVEAGLEGVLQYVTEVAPKQQPFFLVVSLVNPHDITGYPGSVLELCGYNETDLVGDIAVPPTATESLLPTKPYAQYVINQNYNTYLVMGPVDTPEKQKNYVNFYGNMIKKADGYLVELLDALKPLLDKTVVIKTSDHGEGGLSHELSRQKSFNYYKETVHVPMVFSNPKLFPKPRSSDALVSHIDFLPTLAELLGKPKIAPFTGISYAPILLGQKESVQDHVIFSLEDYQYGQAAPPYVPEPCHMMCLQEVDWKFCKYYDPAAEVTKVRSVFEMYNLKKDPNEVTNLASPYHNRTAYEQDQFERLKRKLKEVKRTRLVPRRVENQIAMTLELEAAANNKGQQKGFVEGMPVGTGNITLTAEGKSTKIIISSGSGIIRGRLTGKTVQFTSGTGTYQKIKGEALVWAKISERIFRITGKAIY